MTSPANSLAEVLATSARHHPEHLAVVDGTVTYSYDQLDQQTTALAFYLHQLGLHSGDRVAVMLHNSAGFVLAYFGAVKAGAIVVPLNDHYQHNELLYFIDECQVSVLITSLEFADLYNAVLPQCQTPPKLLLLDTLDISASHDFHVEIDPNAPLMYQYSSGSTGRPKRIARTHANLLFELESLSKTLGITRQDKFLGAAPFTHVNGLTRSMLTSLYSGATLYPLARFERRAAAELIEQNRITIFIAVPFMFSTLAQTNYAQPPDFSSLRLCISASAPMLKKFNQMFFERFGIYVRQLYGSTETGSISVNLSPDIAHSLDSVGTPIEGVTVDVFTDDGQPTPVGEMGEFAVRSPSAITSYYNLEEVNRQTFRNGYFFTGDLGRKDAAGLLYLIGRRKFFINRSGFKIDPREVEEVLEGHPAVAEVVVVGIPTPYGDEKVKAVVVLNASCTEDELVNFCKGKIADFKIPSLVEFRDSLPKSATGKILRTQLK
jgi:long-chain acyl-CoA synthetase